MLYHHTVMIKEWRDVTRDLLCRTILSWRHINGMRGKHVNVSNVSTAKEWTATNNVTSCTKCSLPRVLYKFINLISTLVICLKFVFIEMLDKLITYIVCWYKTLYQVLPVVILVHTTGSTWYKVLHHHNMYVMGIYFLHRCVTIVSLKLIMH
jgi:hypothetical protein